jgi:hypothetical protein
LAKGRHHTANQRTDFQILLAYKPDLDIASDEGMTPLIRGRIFKAQEFFEELTLLPSHQVCFRSIIFYVLVSWKNMNKNNNGSVADPGSRFLPIPYPGSRNPDLGSGIQKQQQKRGVKKKLLSNLFMYFTKLKIILVLKC